MHELASDATIVLMQLPPGPSSPPLVQTLRWFFRPIEFMESARRRYGETFSVRFVSFKTPMVLLSDPEAVRAIYTNRENSLPPGRNTLLEPVVGPRSILLLQGAEHLQRRKLMLPPFHGERMRAYEGVIQQVISDEVDSWVPGSRLELHPRMQAVTLEVILRAVFGVSERRRLERLRGLLSRLLGQTAAPTAQLLGLATRRLGPRGPYARFEDLLGEVNTLLFEEIALRHADPDLKEREDILSLLAAARFEDGEPMSDAEIRDQLMTLLLAGHETTATALAWTFELLLRHPAALERLRTELADGEERYLRAVITESLRVRPVIPIAGRRLASELRVDGFLLPAGTDVTPAIYLTHTRPDIYPEPYAFRPERFLDGGPDTYSWIPFGGGVRRCLGAAFAEFEMRVVLREVVRRCRLEPRFSRPQPVKRRNVTFSPRGGTPVSVLERSARLGEPVAV